jgi:hypothetical protein
MARVSERLRERRRRLNPLAITTVGVNVLTLVVVATPLIFSRNTPNWFLMVQAWVLLVVLVCLIRVYRFNGELRRFERQSTRLEYKVKRNRRMFNNFETYHDAFHNLRDAHHELLRALDEPSSTRFLLEHAQQKIQASLVRFAEFYSSHVGSNCHASIKQIVPSFEGNGDQTKEANIDQFEILAIFRSHPEGILPTFNRVPLSLNSDFVDILHQKRRYFFSSDLRLEKNYRNATLGIPPRYLSTIVWPIRLTPESTGPIGFDTLGFLCIDSQDPNAFQQRQHVYLGAAYADSLWVVLSMFARLKFESREAKVLEPSERLDGHQNGDGGDPPSEMGESKSQEEATSSSPNPRI